MVELKLRFSYLFVTKVLLFFFILVSWINPASAEDEFDPALIGRSLDSVEFQIFVAGFTTENAVDEASRRVSQLRSKIHECIRVKEETLKSITSTLGQDVLDAITTGQPESRDEAKVSSQVDDLNKGVKECKVLLEKSNQLQERLTAHLSDLRERELSKRFPGIVSVFSSGFPELPRYIKNTFKELLELPGVSINRESVIRGGLVIGLSFLAGMVIRRRTPELEFTEGQTLFGQFLQSARRMLRLLAPLILPLVALGIYMGVIGGYQFANSHLNDIMRVLLLYLVAQVLIRAGVKRYSNFIKTERHEEFPTRGLYLRLVIASTLLTLGIIFILLPAKPITGDPAQILFRNLLSTAFLVSLIELGLFLRRVPQIPRIGNFARLVSTLIFSVALILELIGYHKLSEFLWAGVALSLIALVTFYVLEHLFRHFYDGLENGSHPAEVRFRRFLSVKDGEPVPGLLWLRLVTIAGLWVALVFAIMKAWDVSDARISTFTSFVTDGITIGDTQIQPGGVLAGILIFSLLLMAFRWFRDGLDRKYLQRSRMDIGVREALVTVTGYVGFVIAALIGLSVAGFDFRNLAIIAGALSLGIGFGLQNIVNNFVSGIILLFERPIKTGDWIVTGTTEGYVKKIRVRSTEVQTFDKSDVIVPNSELISTKVTNWTLRNKYGRIKIPVGVAYGSDTELVQKLLYEVVEDIPEIIKNWSQMPVKVLFLRFGESSLDFELRAYLYDIEYILDVVSKLHFAIDRKFREHNIEIAFPQRDIHIRSDGE